MLPAQVTMGRSVLDRQADKRTDEQWIEQAWRRARVLRISPKSTTPVRADSAGSDRVDFATAADVAGDGPRWFLGVAADVPYFAVLEDDPGQHWKGLRDLGWQADPVERDALVTAAALTQWHQRHPRCALCGAPTEVRQAGWTRKCPVDDSVHFPRTDPAVIMLVHDGADRCLLGRGAAWPPGRFSTLAGFVEPGESLESAVIREVFEESQVRVRDVRYAGSQPWPFPSSLMVGFFARADIDTAPTPDQVEMLEAGWFTREQVRQAADWTDASAGPPAPSELVDGMTAGQDGPLRAIPPRFSISRYLIDEWLAGRAL